MRRLVAWFRQDYAQAAPSRGHCALVALCGERTGGKR